MARVIDVHAHNYTEGWLTLIRERGGPDYAIGESADSPMTLFRRGASFGPLGPVGRSSLRRHSYSRAWIRFVPASLCFHRHPDRSGRALGRGREVEGSRRPASAGLLANARSRELAVSEAKGLATRTIPPLREPQSAARSGRDDASNIGAPVLVRSVIAAVPPPPRSGRSSSAPPAPSVARAPRSRRGARA